MTSLGELVGKTGLFADGDWVESKDQDPKGEVRLVQLADIGVGEFLDRSHRFLTRQKATELQCTYLAQGDLLVSRMPEPLGRACIYPGSANPCVTVVGACIVRVDQRLVDSRWLMHLLNSKAFKHELHKYTTGTTRPRISRRNLQSIVIDVPSLADQYRITAILDKAEAIRRKRRQALELAEQFLQSAFLKMFGDPVENSKGWPISPLQDLIQPARPVTYGILKPGPDVQNGVPYARVVDIREQRIAVGSLRSTTKEIAEQYRRSRLAAGDLLLTIRGCVGRTAIVPPELEGANITQDTARLSVSAECDEYYLQACLESLPMQRYMQRFVRGAAVKGINLGDVRPLPIPVPPLAQQEAFRALAHNSQCLTGGLRACVRESESLCKSLMHDCLESTNDL